MRIRTHRLPRSFSVIGPGPATLSPGFTLVELVIALALIGLISLLLFSGLRLGTRAWEGVEAAAERTAEPRVARNFLERMLTQARPAQITFDAQEILVFGGDAENLELVAPLSEHVGTPGLYILRLSLEGERQLVLTRWLLHSDVLAGEDGIPEWEPFDGAGGVAVTGALDEDLAAGAYGSTLLLDGVEELEIAYFGIVEGEQDPDWHEEWLEQPRMPQAIRVHLTTPEQTWPDMLIRLPEFAR
jgi:general secretion pathway protein J